MANKPILHSFWHGRIFRYVPLILSVGLILFASSTNGSMSNTSRFIRPLLEFLFPSKPEEILILYHGYIRKFAHFSEYAVLAFFASRVFLYSSKDNLRRFWFLCAFGIVLLTASIDEINQSLDISRTGSVYDVILDCFGGLMMLLSVLIVRHFYNIIKGKHPRNISFS